jgi:Tol biopolymer transport system component
MIAGLGASGSNDDPSMTPDLLELFLESDRAGGAGAGDLWVATRANVTDVFSPPVNLAVLNTAGDDVTPSISSDGLTLVFSSRRAGALGADPNKDLYVSTRPTRTGAWSVPVPIAASRTGDDVSPSVSQDGLHLYFISQASSDDIFVASRATTAAAWGAAVPIAELNSTAEDSGPSINTTETFIVFASTRTPTAGGSDLWSARRASPADPWQPPQRLVELDTAAEETDPWLSPDERTIVFARGNNLFIATR